MKTALALSGGKDSMACLYLWRDSIDCAIYVDTGFSYPETRAMIDHAATIVPVHRIQADRAGQNARFGIPADVVPVEWTQAGQAVTTPKPCMIQSYLQCCFENIAEPLARAAQALGVTHLVVGQRDDEPHRATAQPDETIDGLVRLYPLRRWTAQHVMDYLATCMTIPPHYAMQHSSLDCYDCTAYAKDSQDRIAWTRLTYPDYDQAYTTRQTALKEALWQASA